MTDRIPDDDIERVEHESFTKTTTYYRCSTRQGWTAYRVSTERSIETADEYEVVLRMIGVIP